MIPFNPNTQQQPNSDRVNELALALRDKAQASSRLTGLDEQYARAEALGQGSAKADKWGQVGGLSVLADIMGSDASRAGMRDVRGDRDAARLAVAEGENAGTLYNARTAANKEKTRVNELLTKQNREDAIGELKTAYNKETGEPIEVRLGSKGHAFHAGDPTKSFDMTDYTFAQPTSGKYGKYGSGGTGRGSKSRYERSKSTDAWGNAVVTVFDKWAGEEKVASFADGAEYNREEAEKRGGQRAGQKGTEELAKSGAKYSVKRQGELMETSAANAATLNSVDQAINALEAGAETGPISSRFIPTFRKSTLSLENAQENLALTQIGAYTFGSLSEAEGDWLRRSVIPPLDEDELLPYMQHRKEATLRVMEATKYEREALAAGEEVDIDLINQILSDGGFDIREDGWKK